MKNQSRLNWKSYASFFALYLACTFVAFKSVQEPKTVIWSDMDGYYLYLPASFIYGGFKQEAVRDTSYLRPFPGTNTIYTKYTCGVAVLEAPFFLAAHTLSTPLGYPSDGHSLIYCYAIMMAAVFYMLAGMFLLYECIRKYYSTKAAWLSLAGLLLGTNMFYYTFMQPGMAHIYSFFLFSALIYFTEKIIVPQPATRNFILIGLVSGLLMLVRPTGVIALLYPLYRWLKSTSDWKAFVRNHAVKILLMAASAIIIWIPQIIYWKSVTGQWFLWSYGDESFKYWKEPKLFRVLFDAWNGWLLYSPIALIPLVRLFTGRYDNRHSERVILYILALATYLFASWWAWWFGGAFGHRCYVEYYAFLAIPFAAAIERFFDARWKVLMFSGLYLLLVYYNLGLTYQYQAPWDGPGWTYESVWVEIKKLF